MPDTRSGTIATDARRTHRRVGLFVTCLVDFFRPAAGFATVRLLEEAGCEVVVPPAQTCCGQPAWNAGDRASARDLAVAMCDAFAEVETVVAPSGSCVGMVRQFPQVLGDAHPRAADARGLAERTWELTDFLVTVLDYHPPRRASDGPVVTYHDGCAGLREVGIKSQPRRLLEDAGVAVSEMDAAEVCCGFGGTFCIKYPEISRGMVDDKLASIDRSEAGLVVAGELGCLLNIAGRLTRTGRAVRGRHVAEVLVGDGRTPPLGGEDAAGEAGRADAAAARRNRGAAS